MIRPDKGRVNNPDYTFLSTHYEEVREYLSLLDGICGKMILMDFSMC